MHLTLLHTLPLTLLSLLPILTTSTLIVTTSTRTITGASIPTSTTPPDPQQPQQQSQSPSPQYTSDPLFQSTILNSTNTYRAQHNATALSWNTSLATYAQNWASGCQWSHSHGPNGENLAETYANVTAAVEGWGDERHHYDFSHGSFGEGTGHFTQLVWKSTTSVGCARVDCDNKEGASARGWYVVCEYWPPGNVQGGFGDEVGRMVGGVVGKGRSEAEKYAVYIHDKMVGGAARSGWSGGVVWLVGLVVVVLGVLV